MDPQTLALLASGAGILAFLWALVFGQHSLTDFVERRRKSQSKPPVIQELRNELRTDLPSGYEWFEKQFEKAVRAHQLQLAQQLLNVMNTALEDQPGVRTEFPEVLLRLALERARLLLREGKVQQAAKVCDDLLQIVGYGDALRADALSFRARAYFLSGDFEKAVAFYKESIRLCDSLGKTAQKGKDHTYLGMSYGRQGRFSEAIQSFAEGVSTAYQLGDTYGFASALFNAAYYNLLAGNPGWR